MRRSRLLATLASLAMALTVLGITQGPANAVSRVNTKATLQLSPKTVIYKGTMRVSGEVLRYVKSSKEWKRVPRIGTLQLQRRAHGGGAWKTVATDKSPATYSFTMRGWQNTDYRVRYTGGLNPKGTVRYQGYTSGVRTIWVRRNLHDALIRSGNNFYIWGNIDPGWANSTVYVQRKTCPSCAWKGYKSGKADSRGVFKIGIAVPRSGRWYYRPILPAAGNFVASPGNNIYYTYRSAAREGARLVG